MDGQNWAKYLLLHHQAVLSWGFDDYWTDESAILVNGFTAVDDSSSVVISQHFFDAINVKAIDYLAVVSIILKILFPLVELGQFLHQSRSEFLPYGFVDVEVIHSNACLPAVEEFAEEDAVYCWTDLGSLIHNDWALPSQLQYAGNQVFRRLNCHQSARESRTSETDYVHRQTRHRLSYLYSALYHSEVF